MPSSCLQIISDPHGEKIKISKLADYIILLGDYGKALKLRKGEKGALKELYETSIVFLETLKGKEVYALLGNADINIKSKLLNFFKENNINYAGNKVIRIGNLNALFLDFFMEKWWCLKNKPEKLEKAEKMEEEVKTILIKKPQVDIIFSHNVPYGFFDNNRYGSKLLLKMIKELKPKYCFAGHNHLNAFSLINSTIVISVYNSLVINI